MGQHRTIAIDFDGVIHEYSNGWQGGACYDQPTAGAIQGLEALIKKGYHVVVFTAREDLDAVKEWIDKWSPQLHSVEVTNKKPPAIAYIDDRAIRFTNWRDILNYF